LVVIIGVVAFLLFTVMPQIEHLYHDLHRELPFVTAVLVGASKFAINFWWLLMLLMVGGVYFLKRYIDTEAGRRLFDSFKIHVPLFGNLFRKLYMARFSRTGQTLMATGVPMLEMLRIAARAVNNIIIADAITRSAEKVKGGKSLSSALKKEEVILTLVPQMISIGEQSGGIDKMMGKAASYYENELDNTVRSISTAIEPILMVVLALIAGLMVLAILLPVYGLIGNLPGT
jgi:type IV pilus assembly protein PilC